MRTDDALLSIVIPAYCEADHLADSVGRIVECVEATGHPFEVILVDDGSTDGTWSVIQTLCANETRFRGIRLSRNFGKESALASGLSHCRGRAVIIMDADLQHPPEIIGQMVQIWRDDEADVVEAQKTSRGDEPILVRARRRMVNGMIRRMSGFDLRASSDFKLLDEQVVRAWGALGERGLFFRGMVAWVGFRVVRIPFTVPSGTRGESRWPILSLVELALVGLTGFSAVPLRIASVVGALFFVFAAGASVYTIAYRLLGFAAPGFTTVILLQMFTSSLILICLGIIGEYIGRIYDEVKARPRYVVAESTGQAGFRNRSEVDEAILSKKEDASGLS